MVTEYQGREGWTILQLQQAVKEPTITTGGLLTHMFSDSSSESPAYDLTASKFAFLS